MAPELSEILNHVGENREKYFEAVTPPIIASSNFCFRSIEDMQEKISSEFSSHVYTRGNNPTVEILRKKIAALEGTEECLVFSSGSGAVASAVVSQLKAGDHVVCVRKPYGWTRKLLSQLLSRFDIETSYVDGTDAENYFKACRPNTRLLIMESPNSWTFELQDIASIASFARSRGIRTLIDNSFCSPIGQQPAKLGIDLIVHSATKYMSGHSDVVAGALCGSRQLIEEIFSKEYMTLGAVTSAADAALLIRGLRTLPLRFERSSTTALELVHRLAAHPKVRRVIYPFHPSHPQFILAQKQMSAAGGLFTLELESEAAVREFSKRIQHFLMAVSWGGYESLYMPALGLTGKTSGELLPGGLNTHMIRFYVGLEDCEFLWSDLSKALA